MKSVIATQIPCIEISIRPVYIFDKVKSLTCRNSKGIKVMANKASKLYASRSRRVKPSFVFVLFVLFVIFFPKIRAGIPL